MSRRHERSGCLPRRRRPAGAGRRALAWLLLALVAAGPGAWPVPARAQQEAEADVFVARAILAYEERRWAEALAELRQALALQPDHVDALYYTGLVHMAQEQLEPAAAALERARTLAPEDDSIAFQLGVVHFSQGRYDRAQPLLESVFTRRPTLDGLGYYVGFMRYRQKDYQGALRAFRAGSATDPDLQQLTRFYAGLALAVLGLPAQAAAEIEAAVRLQPASPLTGPAERLRAAVAAQRVAERPFRLEARFGFLYDDNVAINPRPSNDPVVRDLRHRKEDSLGQLLGLRADWTFLQWGALEATATGSFFSTYNDELPAFNVVNYLGALTTTYRGTLATLPYQAGITWSYDYLTLDDDEFVQRHTVAPVFALVEDAHNLTVLRLRWEGKQFAQDTNIPREEKRDGDNWLVGFTHIFRFEGDRHLVKVGYQWDWDDTEGPDRRGRNWAYQGHRVVAGGQYTLPWWDVRLKYDFDVHLRQYRHRHTLLPVDNPGSRRRHDTEYTHVLGAALPLPYGLTLEATLQLIQSRSNLDVFSFDRNVGSLVLIWSY